MSAKVEADVRRQRTDAGWVDGPSRHPGRLPFLWEPGLPGGTDANPPPLDGRGARPPWSARQGFVARQSDRARHWAIRRIGWAERSGAHDVLPSLSLAQYTPWGYARPT